MAVTISGLAKQLKLSKSTVSYALNGGPRSISPEVKVRVLAAAKEAGFRPNPLGQALAAKRSGAIGFVPPQFESDWMFSQFAANTISTLYAEANGRGLHILLPSGYDPARVEETREKLFSAPVDGFILLLPGDPDSLSDLTAMGVPMVAIAARPTSLIPTVNADNKGGATLAVQHLIGLGHRKLGLLGSTQAYDTAERFETFLEFQRGGFMDTRDAWILDSGPTFDEGYRAAQTLLSLSEPPTAVVCVNDIVACACLRVAHELSLRIPGDLSLVGFDDDTVAQMSAIPLTTVRQPIAAMARAAVEGIVSRISGEAVPDRIIPATLIERNTTTPLRK